MCISRAPVIQNICHIEEIAEAGNIISNGNVRTVFMWCKCRECIYRQRNSFKCEIYLADDYPKQTSEHLDIFATHY